MSIIQTVKRHPKLRALTLRLLMPDHQARPRWWVKVFLNPLIHRKGKNAMIRRRTRMDVLPFHNFYLGHQSTIEEFSVVNNGMGDVYIGDGSRIGMSNTLIGPVKIGNNVIIAQNVVITALNQDYQDIHKPIRFASCSTSEVIIDDDSWIGANTVITAGVRIGKHVVVARGSVVTKSTPDFCIVAGNPAKIIKVYDASQNVWIEPDSPSDNLKIAI